MGRYNAAGQERVDLLDDNLRQARDADKTYCGNARQNEQGHATTLLLDGLYAPHEKRLNKNSSGICRSY